MSDLDVQQSGTPREASPPAASGGDASPLTEGQAPWSALLTPKRPHDDLPFDELARRYNFLQTSDRRAVFVRLIRRELEGRPGPTRVLDIGAGNGIGKNTALQAAIAQRCDELWGVEPDEGVVRNDGIFHRFQHALMETAALPENAFDVAYAYMVMEHVADPDAFLTAVRRVLKPGGVFLFMTPNKRHYFTICANLLRKIRLEEFTLGKLRRKEEVEAYHYPVVYAFNTPGQIDRAAKAAGMDAPGYAYLESDGPRPYMKGPLIPVFHLMKLKRSLIKDRGALLTLVGRISRPMTPQREEATP
ncbi:MAG: class I SAM-dependent methyltransferase [Phycisphaeraceae bacterium]|nr:class I SAM-dependent methyltransferase [Phycisphaeraceae bacterium]